MGLAALGLASELARNARSIIEYTEPGALANQGLEDTVAESLLVTVVEYGKVLLANIVENIGIF